jgi:hypothetical protein
MICCRKINDELNVFAGITENAYFAVVWIMICVLQVLLICFAGRVFKCHAAGLTVTQWLWTVLPGLASFFINFMLKFIPDSICPILGSEEEEDVTKASKEYSRLKRNISVSIRNSGVFKQHNK